MGAPLGNQNAKRAKRYEKAIERALANACGGNVDDGLDKAAAMLVSACFAGDQWALKELGDRIDGKPAQVIAGDPDNPLELKGLAVFWGNGSQAP